MKTPEVRIAFAGLWLICLGFLAYPPCAQMCAGMSRLVLLGGIASLSLVWPGPTGWAGRLRGLAGWLPLLALALALDLQAGMGLARGFEMAFHGVLLCLGSACLGGAVPGRFPGWSSALVGAWFLLPLALGTWAHVAGGVEGRWVSLSPVGSYWTHLGLFGVGAGLGQWVHTGLLGLVGAWFVLRRRNPLPGVVA